jgi:hypothetical protein
LALPRVLAQALGKPATQTINPIENRESLPQTILHAARALYNVLL